MTSIWSNSARPEARTPAPWLAAAPDGRFGLHDVRAALTEPLADSLIPVELSRLEGLSLLTRLKGPDGDVVRFSDEALPFFIWMRLARDEFGGGTTRQAA
ncbi:MAG: hypothetical protein ACKOAM_00705 [Chakrabartia sp.]